MRKNYVIREKQYGGSERIEHGYRYHGIDKPSGLHMFTESDGGIELFQKRKTAPAGWHLIRGAYCYEFVRSL